MEKHSSSLMITVIWTRIVLVLWLLLALGIPALLEEMQLIVLFYLVFLPVLVCIGSMDNLLNNIRLGQVFSLDNIRQLRRISWGCFWAALILLLACWMRLEFILISGVIGFFGLLMRVIKNMMSTAILLKEENDYTI